MMRVEPIKKPDYCEFIAGSCTKDECAAFRQSRPMTQVEIENFNSADVPVIDPFIRNWCLKHNKVIHFRFIL